MGALTVEEDSKFFEALLWALELRHDIEHELLVGKEVINPDLVFGECRFYLQYMPK